ncbi:MAG: diphosphomevalonate decarboxylase [Flavobacteriaceae bacterium]|nr:diphosphomevalonate decarboxylase [Flavobacteriaceae bacterium]
MEEIFFTAKPYLTAIDSASVEAEAPSNIALVKYWGKKTNQIPANPSVSFTLSNAKTRTRIDFEKRENQHPFSFKVYFEGKINQAFKPKIAQFFERVQKHLPLLSQYHLDIFTENTFPHSSGIASSASGMAALSLCLCDFERRLTQTDPDVEFWKKVSFLARLGSGSACRSLKGPVVLWGANQADDHASDLYGTLPSFQIHQIFQDFQDTILLIDKGEKQVSSSVGHGLMHAHPFANQRFAQAHLHLHQIKEAFITGNILDFIRIVESEALSLHAMMMTSEPYFLLMKPETLKVIEKIWLFRAQTDIPVCFTLDAGANVHVLYPNHVAKKVREFIQSSLLMHCENNQFIDDFVGEGAKIIS